jgi:predicted ABC-type ATPase
VSSPKDRANVYINSENKKPLIGPKKSYEAEVDDDELIHSENPYGDAYLNAMAIPDIPLHKLESKIAEKRKDNDDGFQREYAVSSQKYIKGILACPFSNYNVLLNFL